MRSIGQGAKFMIRAVVLGLISGSVGRAAELPFVIAETGMSGKDEKHPRALALMKAQAAVAEYEESKGNVAFAGTREFWREPADSPTGQGYHWNTNAETYYLIGEAMGTAMKGLCETNPPTR